MSGGGGGSRPDGKKTAWTLFFFKPSVYFTVYRGVQWKIYFPKDPEGVQHFPGGWGPTLSRGGGGGGGGGQMLISIETDKTCDFPGGGGGGGGVLTPHPPSGLWIRT